MARLKHEEAKQKGKKRKITDDNKDDELEEEDAEAEFDMGSVDIPDLELSPHAVTEEYRADVS